MAKGTKNDSPTGTGNTVGTIVGQAPQAKRSPKEANPPVKSESLQDRFGRWRQLGEWFRTVATPFASIIPFTRGRSKEVEEKEIKEVEEKEIKEV
ncbi:hypothetical protein, partial [Xenorhabdus cabanillasii]